MLKARLSFLGSLATTVILAIVGAVYWSHAKGTLPDAIATAVSVPITLSKFAGYAIVGLTLALALWRSIYVLFSFALGIGSRGRALPSHRGPAATPSSGLTQPVRAAYEPRDVGALDSFKEQHRQYQASGAVGRDDATELRIGIVLSGGGAKGVYQAGALRAVWEFLREQDVLNCVRVIAGTSIGSWNAVFWLADRVGNGELREWWRSVRTSTIIAPSYYLPLWSNYFARADPWRADFNTHFANSRFDVYPYFYLTRTNVTSATLEMTSNRTRRSSAGRFDYRDLNNADRSASTELPPDALKEAVFASMDLPPLFQRIRYGDDVFEDGGIIDNLPIRYATWYEGCNLLFVLPLNSTFKQNPSGHGLLSRLARVMDIRQGALEHSALRQISLYNEIIAAGAAQSHRHVNVHSRNVTTFCICPDQPLTVDTTSFWRLGAHGGECEEMMYEATKAEAPQVSLFPQEPRSADGQSQA